MRIKTILTLTLTLGPRHTFSYALGIMASVPRTGPKAGAPPPGTQPEALLPFMPAVFPPTPGPGMLPGMIPQMPGFQPGQPGRIPQTPLPMFPVQAAICCPHCTGPVWLSVDANGSVTSQAITLASASSTAPAVAAQAQDEAQVRSRIPSTPEHPSPPDASAGPPPPQSGGAKKRSPSKTAAPADATKADSPMVVPKAVFVSAPWAAAQKAAQQDLAAPTLWTMGTAPPPAAPGVAPATPPALTTPPPAAPAAPQPLVPWPSLQGPATSSPGSARPSTAAPRSRSPPAPRPHDSGLQNHAWSSIFRAVSYKETFKDLC